VPPPPAPLGNLLRLGPRPSTTPAAAGLLRKLARALQMMERGLRRLNFATVTWLTPSNLATDRALSPSARRRPPLHTAGAVGGLLTPTTVIWGAKITGAPARTRGFLGGDIAVIPESHCCRTFLSWQGAREGGEGTVLACSM
jgi:hypothetical protein